MRLWHKNLIPVLPRQQLISQYREVCAIARNISVNGTPHHLLVNKVMDYPIDHLFKYGCLVAQEMWRRGYNCDFSKFEQHFIKPWDLNIVPMKELFPDWHNERYMWQCFYNLQEKYDCGGISKDEYNQIKSAFTLYIYIERKKKDEEKYI